MSKCSCVATNTGKPLVFSDYVSCKVKVYELSKTSFNFLTNYIYNILWICNIACAKTATNKPQGQFIWIELAFFVMFAWSTCDSVGFLLQSKALNVRLTCKSKLSVNMNGLSHCVSPVMDWWPVKAVLHLFPVVSCDMLHCTSTPYPTHLNWISS